MKLLAFKAPKYPELKVESVWNLVKTDKEISSFFPDYESAQYPERDYLFAALSTTRKDELIKLIKTVKNNTAYSNQTEDDVIIQIKDAISNEIFNVLPSKSKFLLMITAKLQLRLAKLHSY